MTLLADGNNIHSGTQGVIYVGTDKVLNIRSFSLEETMETIDATTMDTDGVTHRTTRPTFQGWNGSFECYWTVTEAYDETADPNVLESASSDAMTFTRPGKTLVEVHFWPTGDSQYELEYKGSGYITNRTISSAVDGMVEMSVTIAGTGAVTTATKA